MLTAIRVRMRRLQRIPRRSAEQWWVCAVSPFDEGSRPCQARTWFTGSPRRLAAIGGTGGLAMIGVGLSVAATGRHD